MVRIGLMQMKCEKAAIRENLENMARYLKEAKQREINIIGFPEMCITGYADPNKYPQAVIPLDGPEVRLFLRMTEGVPATVLAGLIEKNAGSDNQTPRKPFITHIVARDGKLLGWYRKRTIKDDEELWFSAGETAPVFEHNGIPFGIAICADISNEMVFADCARQGAKIVFELAAPGLYGEQSTRNWQSGFDWWKGECNKKLGHYASEHKLWIAVATQAGRTVDEDFPGGGYVFDPGGQCRWATPDWTPGAVFLELDMEGNRVLPI